MGARGKREAFSTIAAASIGHALQHKSDPPKRQENLTFILLAMRIESSKRPSNLIACLNHGAVHIYRQTVQTQSLDLLVDQYTVQLR